MLGKRVGQVGEPAPRTAVAHAPITVGAPCVEGILRDERWLCELSHELVVDDELLDDLSCDPQLEVWVDVGCDPQLDAWATAQLEGGSVRKRRASAGWVVEAGFAGVASTQMAEAYAHLHEVELPAGDAHYVGFPLHAAPPDGVRACQDAVCTVVVDGPRVLPGHCCFKDAAKACKFLEAIATMHGAQVIGTWACDSAS